MRLLAIFGLGFLAACSGAPAVEITAVRETVAVASSGDAADDPTIWLAPDPLDSLVLGTDKQAGLYAYNLDGSIAQHIPAGRVNNVDLRYDFALPGPRRDIAVASDRTNIGLAVFLIDPETRHVEAWPTIPVADVADPYGACLYQSESGALYAFLTDKEPGTVVQLLLRYEGEGVISGTEVRRFATGSTTEGCVADDRTGRLYIAEENVALWSIGAEPDAGTELTHFADVDGRFLVADAEGVAIIPRGDAGGWLIVSSQGDSRYVTYDLDTGEPALRFAVVDGALDGTSHTDGLDVFPLPLGPEFPEGVFVVQDDEEDSGGQNFKLIDLRDIRAALSTAEE
ncbi:phytase [Maricaulis sp. MIT060901]|uniref:phytase n=1 Tax=Maricaulis sp. MIT060901 TaxID=3096993 RepID=UPI00399BB55F